MLITREDNVHEGELKFLLLDSVTGWRAKYDRVVESEEKNALCLKTAPVDIKDEIGTFGGLDLPTGFALDLYGNIYILHLDENEILIYDLCADIPAPIKQIGGFGTESRRLHAPHGIAISHSGDLYISDTHNHRVQVFSVKGLVLRSVWGKVDGNGLPIEGSKRGEFNLHCDLAIDSDDNIYVVDKGNHRVQKFNKAGEYLGEFGKVGITNEAQLSNPEHIAIDASDQIYVADDKDFVRKFSSQGDYLSAIYLVEEVSDSFTKPALTVDRAGRIHFKIRFPKYLFFSDEEPDVKSSVRMQACHEVLDGVIPGIFYQDGKLIVGTDAIPEPVEEAVEYVPEGTIYTGPLDSLTYKCPWHKIELDADIPEGTSLEVRTYTSELKKEPHEVVALPDSFWLTNQVNAEEFLIQSPPGRFLCLRISLKSNLKATPFIKSIRIYYPRQSYLQFLPKVYQEDPTSKLFLERFLSLFEHFFSEFEDKITYIARYFNPDSVEIKLLPWLASWLSLTLDDNWPEEKRRELIKRAHQFFNMRGTLRGLQELLKLYTGEKLPILEHFNMRRWLILGDDAILGCNSLLWGVEGALGQGAKLEGFQLHDTGAHCEDPLSVHSHKFSLFVPSSLCNTEVKERSIKRIVDLWKPAHTKYFFCKVEPKFRVGLQSMIGVNTILGKYPLAILGTISSLGKNSILAEPFETRGAPTFRLNGRVRLDGETIIN
jgi:phage tail-like protein